jgi:hypothetical protein
LVEITEREQKLLLSLICYEQVSILKGDRSKINNNLYKELDNLRIKIENIECI